MMTFRYGAIRRLGCAILAMAAPTLGAQDASASPLPPFDPAAFEAACAEAGGDPTRLEAFRAEAAELGLAIAADHLVRDVSPAFGRAVERGASGDPRAALELTRLIAGTRDTILQAYARYHLARLFLDGDDPEGAVEVLEEFLQQHAGQTPLDGEAVFFYATALAELPMAQTAVEILEAYLHWFPDAPARFRAAARQRIRELAGRNDAPLHGLADDMKWCARRIRRLDTGDDVQQRQQDAIDALQRLIDEMQDKETRSGSAAGSSRSSPRKAADQSALPDGTHQTGSPRRRVHEITEFWVNMPQGDRDAIEAEMQAKLPESHKARLRAFYERLGRRRR